MKAAHCRWASIQFEIQDEEAVRQTKQKAGAARPKRPQGSQIDDDGGASNDVTAT